MTHAGDSPDLAAAELRRLGWDAAWQAVRDVADPAAAWQPVRIAAEHRGAYQAIGPLPAPPAHGIGDQPPGPPAGADGTAPTLPPVPTTDSAVGTAPSPRAGSDAAAASSSASAWVELPGRAFRAASDKRDLPTVGDWVLVDRWADAVAGAGAAVVRAVLPRRSFLVRRAAGEATVPQPVAANVDTGLVLTSANADLSLARLDRYISLLRDGGIAPVLVLSKVDLIADPAPLLAQLQAIAPRVVAISVVTGAGFDELRALGAPGTTCVLLGSSGVGKSSLLNLIAGTEQTIRAIRDDDRGRHTTTRRELFVSASGSLWIDTPGMRELGQWVDEADDDEAAFDDIAALAQHCKFRDCRHRDEPGCAVRDAIPAARLASYHKLSDERRTGVTRQSLAQKLAESRKAKAKKPAPPSED